jgi:hypothetical protein
MLFIILMFDLKPTEFDIIYPLDLQILILNQLCVKQWSVIMIISFSLRFIN